MPYTHHTVLGMQELVCLWLHACLRQKKKGGGRGAVSCEQVVPGYRSLVSCSAQCGNKVGMLH